MGTHREPRCMNAADRLLPPELQHRQRYQRIVGYLYDNGGPCSTSALTRCLVTAEGDVTDVDQSRSLYLWLHRTGLPTLTALGVIDHDESIDQVRLTTD